MSDLPHLRLEGEPVFFRYTYAGGTPQGVTFDLPASNQPVHAKRIGRSLETAGAEADRRRSEAAAAHPELVEWKPEGIVLTFQSDPDHELNLESLERRGGIHLLGMRNRPDSDGPGLRA